MISSHSNFFQIIKISQVPIELSSPTREWGIAQLTASGLSSLC